MAVNVSSRRKNSHRAQKERSCEPFKQWLRGRPCFLENKGGCGLIEGRKPVEFAHVDCAGGKGMALKVGDWNGLPLCPRHHNEQHGTVGSFRNRGGWKTFQLKYGFDAVAVAAEYWRRWPGRPKWEADNGA